MPDQKKQNLFVGFLARHRGRILALAVVVLAVLAVVLVYQSVPNRDRSIAASQSAGIAVETALVRLRPSLEDRFELKGIVEPTRVVRLSPEVTGAVDFIAPRDADKLRRKALQNTRQLAAKVLSPDRLEGVDPEVMEILAEYALCKELATTEAVAIDQGDHVSRNQPILYLNADLLLAAYNKARAQMEYDLRELNKYRELQAEGGASVKDVEDRRLTYETSRAGMESARTNLLRTVVRSPIAGTLNRLMVEKGELVGPGTASSVVAEIVDQSRLKVAVDVPEADIAYFQVGQKHRVIEVAGRDIDLAGTVTYISKTAEGAARKTRIELTLGPEALEVLRPGNIVTVRLVRREMKDVILAPLQAIIPGNDQKIAYVVSQGRAQRRVLQIDLRTVRGTDVLVRSGLTPGDRLIVKGQRQCADGQVIREVPMEMTLESTVEYEVEGEVDPSQLSDVMRRLSQKLTGMENVGDVKILSPGDAKIPVLLNLEQAGKRGLGPEELAELLGLETFPEAFAQAGQVPAWLISRSDRGYEQMPIRHRVIWNDPDQKPVLLWQVASSVGEAQEVPQAAPRLIVSALLQGASRQEVLSGVSEPIAAALKRLGAATTHLQASPDLTHVEATFPEGADEQEILAAVREALAQMASTRELPAGLEGPVVAGRPGLPTRKLLIAARPGADESAFVDQVAKALESFRSEKSDLTAGLRFAQIKPRARQSKAPAVAADNLANTPEVTDAP